jgi:hypothetical protein
VYSYASGEKDSLVAKKIETIQNLYMENKIQAQQKVLSQFFSTKTFFTLSGASAGVWIFCIVVGAIFPPNAITPVVYRIIALCLSEFIAIIILWRVEQRTLENYVLSVFNGLLIFIHASGWNVITANNFFSDKVNSENKRSVFNNHSKQSLADFFGELHQINWWQDNGTFKKNISLANENDILKKNIDTLKSKLDTCMVQNEMSRKNLPANSVLDQHIFDSLKLIIKDQNLLVRKYQGQLNETRNKKFSDTDYSTAQRINILQSMNYLRKAYQDSLKMEENEIWELESKIMILKTQIQNCCGIDRVNH